MQGVFEGREVERFAVLWGMGKEGLSQSSHLNWDLEEVQEWAMWGKAIAVSGTVNTKSPGQNMWIFLREILDMEESRP